MTQSVTDTKQIYYECRLSIENADDAVLIEELLWTLDGVESVTYCHDTDENVAGLLVVGLQNTLEAQVKELLQTQSFKAAFENSRIIEEEDWSETWKQYWRVERLLPHLVIQPSWEPFTPEPHDIVLKLDPGSAFGTGTHETTQLMLLAISDLMNKRGAKIKSCLDVGCGSGILAIYAAKRGVGDVAAIDNDLQAVDVALENAAQNNVNFKSGSSLTDANLNANYDLVIANILTNTILELLPDLISKLAPGGYLLLSGITTGQAVKIRDGLKSYPIQIQRLLIKGGWTGFVCQKTN